MIDKLIHRIESFSDELAVASESESATYGELLEQYQDWRAMLARHRIENGHVLSLEGEYGVPAVAAMLALATSRNIIVPLSRDSKAHRDKFLGVAQVEWRIDGTNRASPPRPTGARAAHPLYSQLRDARHAGLVLFTSGSTGENKAVVHDLELLLEKLLMPRQRLRTVVFLQLDHIGGMNTLLYTLANGGTVVVPQDRSPAAVCAAIEKHRAELLPTSPTFLNLLLLSDEYKCHDLSSLRLITYGTEPMPASTLERVGEALPNVTLQQTYGMTELGILRSKSRDPRSLWVRVGGEGYDTRVVDGRLFVRAKSAMLGYLNAASPFDADGFLDTGDRVEVDGDWLRILGRQSEIVNVGGNKVFPAEVESVLLEMDGVVDAVVRGEPHPLTGQIVTATVQLSQAEVPQDFRTRMRCHCRNRLPAFAIPVKVAFAAAPLHNSRFKRIR